MYTGSFKIDKIAPAAHHGLIRRKTVLWVITRQKVGSRDSWFLHLNDNDRFGPLCIACPAQPLGYTYYSLFYLSNWYFRTVCDMWLTCWNFSYLWARVHFGHCTGARVHFNCSLGFDRRWVNVNLVYLAIIAGLFSALESEWFSTGDAFVASDPASWVSALRTADSRRCTYNG